MKKRRIAYSRKSALLVAVIAMTLSVIALDNPLTARAQSGTPSTDRAALVALYNATDGDNWTNKENWTSTQPIGEWYGVTTDSEGRVTRLHLENNNLTGVIPTELANLSNLMRLVLWDDSLTGTIPTELSNLSNLTDLALSGGFAGAVPNELGRLQNLRSLQLNGAGLTGSIPTELGNLSNLGLLSLQINRLTGSIPVSLCNLIKLEVLVISYNELTGEIPSCLGELSNLIWLSLEENQLTGRIPPELGQLSNLQDLSLHNNRLTGTVPPQLGNLSSLTDLYLHNNRLTDPLPHSLTNLTALENFTFGDNSGLCAPTDEAFQTWLQGIPIVSSIGPNCTGQSTTSPVHAGDRATLVALYNATGGDNWTDNANWLSDRPLGEWHGVATNDEGRVTKLELWVNNLTGAIPTELGNLSGLTYLFLDLNQLSGTIPSELGNLSKLKSLGLLGNQLSGPIPSELGNLSVLQHLGLGGNQLTGSVPPELGQLSNLRQIWLDQNQLSGAIPSDLGRLSNLTELYLYENQLSGAIPAELGRLSSLEELWLGENQLSGPIPPELGNLSNLTELLLDGNQLSGEIPPPLGDLSNLTKLYIHDNQLSGTIPLSFTSLTSLEGFYFENNAGLCAPDDIDFQSWLQPIPNRDEGPSCGASNDKPFVLEWSSPAASVGIGESFTLSVTVRDAQEPGDHGGISVSFPSLSAADESTKGNLYSSSVADVELVADTTSVSNVGFYDSGDTDSIHDTEGEHLTPEYLLIESDDPTWSQNDVRTLTLQITPKQEGEFPIRIRGWICADEYGDCDRQPDSSDTSDQQGWPAEELTVSVACTEDLGELTTALNQEDLNSSAAWTSDCASANREETYARSYRFTLTQTATVQIDLSSDVNTYLHLLEEDGSTIVQENDNISLFNQNSRISRLLLPRTYTVEATTRDREQTGDFTLSIAVVGFSLAASSESFGEPIEVVRLPGDADSGHYWTFVPSRYTSPPLKVAEEIHGRDIGGLEDRNVRIEAYKTMLLEMAIQPAARPDAIVDLEFDLGENRDLGAFANDVARSYDLAADIASLLGRHLNNLPLGTSAVSAVGLDLVDVGIAAAVNRTVEVTQATENLDLLEAAIIGEVPDGDAWEEAFRRARQDIADMTSDDALARWGQSVADHSGQLLTTVSRIATTSLAKYVAGKILLTTAPISLTVGLASFFAWEVVDQTGYFWDELTYSTLAGQMHVLLYRQSEGAPSKSLDYLKFSFYQHLHQSSGVTVSILSDIYKPQNARQEIWERRDLALQEVLESSTNWIPTKDFNSLTDAGRIDPQGIWSDGATMWVVNDFYDTIYSYDMTTKRRNENESISLCRTTLNCDISKPRGIWSDRVNMWVVAQVRAGSITPYRILRYSRISGNLERISRLDAGNTDPTGIWSDGQTLWVADAMDTKFYAYDLSTNLNALERNASRDLSLAIENRDPTGIWSDGVTMWVADTNDDRIYAYILSTGERDESREIDLLRVFNVADNGSPTGIWSNGDTMWVADFSDDKIFAYSLPEGSQMPDTQQPTFTLDVKTSDRSVEVGESFILTVEMHLTKGEGEHGGISVSFPQLIYDGGDEQSHSSLIADVEWVPAQSDQREGVSGVTFYQPGEGRIHRASDNKRIRARRLLVESDESWPQVSERVMTLRITPKQAGEFSMLVRGWICAREYTNCAREPESSSFEDQQGWPVEVLTATVTPAVSQTAPDLVIDSNGVSQRELQPGERFTMRFDVLNQGDAASTTNASVRYFRSADSAIPRNDTELTVEDRITAVGPLDPSRSHSASISLTAVLSGSYYYGACVGTVPGESNTQNNCASVLRVSVSEPDLVVVSPSVSEDEVDAGEVFEFSATVENVGGRRTPDDTFLYYYRSSNSTITTKDLRVVGRAGEDYDTVPELDPDDDSEESVDLTAPNDADTYYYGACVVAVSGERETSNNCSRGVAVTVDSAIQGAPDLVPDRPMFSDYTPQKGGSVKVWVTVKNEGNKQSDTTTLQLWRSTKENLQCSGFKAWESNVKAIDVGKDLTKSLINLSVPSYAGTYYFHVKVLPVEGESESDNNCSSRTTMIVE